MRRYRDVKAVGLGFLAMVSTNLVAVASLPAQNDPTFKILEN